MITEKGKTFVVSTEHTSYMMTVLKTGHLVHLGYGPRINEIPDPAQFLGPEPAIVGTVCYWDDDHPGVIPTNLALEYSAPFRGDNREAALVVDYGNGATSLDLLYKGHRVYEGKDISSPISLQPEDGNETLEIELYDSATRISVTLSYTVFPCSDVIVRSAILENNTKNDIVIKNIASMQMDIPSDGWTLYSYDGAWARERYEHRRELQPGITIIDSKLGFSGNEHNPLIYLENSKGEAYGFNLIYSGNHRELVEVSPFGKTRVMNGINPYGFEWKLAPGEYFTSPEAIMVYSKNGREDAALSFHSFINEFIVSGKWRKKERPVLLNSWEGCYFDFDEEKVYHLAECAKELGAELFVLDDGWFGKRTDDTKGLGDWYTNRDRFPNGMEAFAERIRSLGLIFGIWMEPEMVNMDSDLYRAHPDWIISHPKRRPLPCRHQFILDLSREDVREYIHDSVALILNETRAGYIKWDMNRAVSDLYSFSDENHPIGELLHRYIFGLYDILGRLKKEFPDVLFEGCASGGNRYDLAMLMFMPQTWASDNTDLYDRVSIQEGTLSGYPLSTMGAHVSASPGHQSLRVSRIDSRFNIAAFGVLGYELDVTRLSEEEKNAIKDQIAFYKKYRKVFQYGEFRKLRISDNQRFWYTTLGKTTIALEIQTLNEVHTGRNDRLYLPIAEDGKMYRISARKEYIPSSFLGDKSASYGKNTTEDFVAEVSGTILREYGLVLGPQFTGKEFQDSTRILGDFGSRMYVIEELG